MARRRGRGTQTNPATNPEGLGVGALAEGQLAHGERGVVESVASQPGGQGGGGQAQGQPQRPQGRRADQDVFAPTSRPDQPPEAGLPVGPGGGGMVLADDPDEFLRVAHEVRPHPDLVWLLENREF